MKRTALKKEDNVMNFNMLHPADQLVMMMERIYSYGMTTTSGGNLSIRDTNGDIWITPGSVDKGSLTRSDIVCVKPDGTVVGNHKPSSEFPVHKKIYETRPELRAVLHAHPPALVAFSIVRVIPETKLIPKVAEICGSVAFADYDVPGSIGLSEKIASKFAEGHNVVMLENHGVFIGNEDIFAAFKAFETFDFCARLQIEALKVGKLSALTPAQLSTYKEKQAAPLDEFVNKNITSEEKASRRDMIKFVRRAYSQKLFTSTQGTFSQRLSDGSIIITPYKMDREYLEPEDLVKISHGFCEQGKTPSKSVQLHMKIYEQHPEINSIIIAHSPHIMAFAVSDAEFDSRTIPESYIMLRDVKKLPFGVTFRDHELVSRTISHMTPIVLLENDGVLVTGASLLNAFDKLEVMEYSAKAILNTQAIGEVVKISDGEVKELREAFRF